MDILFVATELAPYAKVGGLADFIAALTKTLRQQDHHVTLALPRFPHFEDAGLLVARRLTSLQFELGGAPYNVTVYDGRLPSGVDITLLDVPGFFDRKQIYGEDDRANPDDVSRFAVFCRAAVELAQQRANAGNGFDAIHVHDWAAALVPLYAKISGDDQLREQVRHVLTIHDLAYQGVVDAELLERLGLGPDLFHPEGVEFFGRINLLKAGVLFADAITTVSRTYAREIQQPAHGGGLEGVLASRSSVLTGIVNGIDYALYNPATDPALAARYDADDPSPKIRCKTALLLETGLEMVPERPLVAIVGRLVEQKGIDLVLDALPALLRSDVALLVAGEGERELIERLQRISQEWTGRVAFLRAPPEPLVHRILGGSDIMLVPSRFEPCGVMQQYGQRYGAVPVAHATGGIVDTIVDCDAALETGTGFLFDEPTVPALVGAIQRAIAAYGSGRWPSLQRRVMHLDLGWDRAAHRYVQVYKRPGD